MVVIQVLSVLVAPRTRTIPETLVMERDTQLLTTSMNVVGVQKVNIYLENMPL